MQNYVDYVKSPTHRVLPAVVLFANDAQALANPLSDHPAMPKPPVQRLAGCPGIGGRIRLEWLAGSNRNHRPDAPEMRSYSVSDSFALAAALAANVHQRFLHSSAYRKSWEIHRGEIPPKGQLNHHCDHPRCVNPDHVDIGTHEENMSDKREKKRGDGDVGHMSDDEYVGLMLLSETVPLHVLGELFERPIRVIAQLRRYPPPAVSRVVPLTKRQLSIWTMLVRSKHESEVGLVEWLNDGRPGQHITQEQASHLCDLFQHDPYNARKNTMLARL